MYLEFYLAGSLLQSETALIKFDFTSVVIPSIINNIDCVNDEIMIPLMSD